MPLIMLAISCSSLLRDHASSYGKHTSQQLSVCIIQLCTQVSGVIMACWHLLAQQWSIRGAAEA